MKRKFTKALTAVILTLLLVMGMTTAAFAANDHSLSDATQLVFSDSEISVSNEVSKGYEIDGTSLKITESGTYAVSGECRDGSITIKKGTEDVTLILNGLTLTSENTAPITCNKSTSVSIVAAAGTINTLTDSEKNNDETYTDNTEAENAVIKTKDGSDVTICGTGTININSNGKNGIKGGAATDTEGDASLTIKDVTLNITANAGDGLKSDQELNILSGSVTVSAADDAIKSDLALNIGAENTEGPVINITKSEEGIEGAVINIYSGSITVHSTDDGINAANSDLDNYNFECNIYGGKVYVDASNGDGIDSNGTINLAGGTVEVFSQSSGDNSPIDAEKGITYGGATVLAVGAAGMQSNVKAQTPYITFGAAGGMGGMGGMGGFGKMNRFENQTDGAMPQMPNGESTDESSQQSGGRMRGMPSGEMPQMPNSETTDESSQQAGGRMRGMPSGEMPQMNDSQSSEQNQTFGGKMQMPEGQNGTNSGKMQIPGGGMQVNAIVTAGSTIEIVDSQGSTVYSATAVRDASYVLFTSPDLKSDGSYTLKVNSSDAGTATASTASVSAGENHTDRDDSSNSGGNIFQRFFAKIKLGFTKAYNWIKNLFK